jgi:arsenate reductase-like glutaredoxin family protein
MNKEMTDRERLVTMMQDAKLKLEAGWLPDSNNVLQPPPTKKEICQWLSDHESEINEGIEAIHRMKQSQPTHLKRK